MPLQCDSVSMRVCACVYVCVCFFFKRLGVFSRRETLGRFLRRSAQATGESNGRGAFFVSFGVSLPPLPRS